ncbi:lysine--tRNA ligase [Treponema phagedenis]|uniref:Lysine--tRNA ligase n=1 Tax=Treponema phagedenis TaxID=162 RepID=A0A0B7GX24_TREPH|nr:lysine--tRNA ligase [Treponema phagedenis]NVP22755.1 lysine--tRNA ligase [Treponema phagedenis]QEJ95291.1 lysine--tRNA ligase [Treponema phagedenis]QKS92527.1 lysine--tRNA ligase [Treponema phagedenis]QLC57661.1 lysine--tRNA ligase [Treponema phagedenis]QSH99189.1 lysine--tRNA ligase [Treponema phagedenis]
MANEKKLLHWADQTAEKIIRECGDLEQYTCASGITPSGTVHIGNFREIISVDLVVRALRDRGKNVRFIYSWDDYDVFRKVPENMPNPEVLAQYLRFPITMVPDTFGRDESYAKHHEHDVESVLPEVGIFPEYLYQAERYRAGMYAEGMKTAMDNREKIKELLNTYRDEDHKITGEYWPVSVFCTACNKDTTTVDSWSGEWSLHYTCECGNAENLDLRTASVAKLGWRVDWPMRWAYENVVFEPAGKDHHSQGGSFDTARLVSSAIYNKEAPISFRYDFIGLKGLPGKMSSSKGKVISLPDVLEVYQPEVVRYLFASTRPNTEFAISFDLDVIKTYEDYDKTERIAWGVQKAKNETEYEKEKRIYELSQVAGMPFCIAYQVPFRHLCNLLQINSGDIEAVISLFPDMKPEQVERFRRRCTCAWNWIRDSGAPEDFKFALRTDGSKAELSQTITQAIQKIVSELLPKMDSMDEKEFSTALYDVARHFELEPKDLFVGIYTALIAKSQGPRLAGFMKIIGAERLRAILSVY